MRRPVQRIVLIPRYTAFAGETDFYTPPMNVRQFSEVILTLYVSKGLGSDTPTGAVQVEDSADLKLWAVNGSSFWGPGNTEVVEELDLNFEWIRVKVSLSEAVPGVPPGATLYLIGDFVPRET